MFCCAKCYLCSFVLIVVFSSYVSCWNYNNALDFGVMRQLLQRTNLGSNAYTQSVDSDDTENFKDWTGRWFPEKPIESPRKLSTEDHLPSKETETMQTMINSACDDGKTNLTVDWPDSPENYTCFDPKHRFEPDQSLAALIVKDSLPKAYHARHVCMDKEIIYGSNLPTFGPHRPAWPRYGEYIFVPKQRWIHSLEHGAVVMLYHPCAHPFFITKLKKVVESCLYRHIITPYTMLPHERPFALVTWGWALLMSDIDVDNAKQFIKDHALSGPEHTSNDGQYDHMLIKPSKILSTVADSILCPNY